MKRFEFVDSLRGVAILMVLFLHAGVESKIGPGILTNLSFNARYGVHLFFVVSAFTLTASYYYRRNEKDSTSNFFLRRFFRIAPLYYAGVLVYSLYRIDAIPLPAWWVVPANLVFLHSLSPISVNSVVPGGWSVGNEFLFYMLLPLLLPVVSTLNRAVILTVLAIIIRTAAIFLMQRYNLFADRPTFQYCWFPNTLPAFSMGILSYFLINRIQGEGEPRRGLGIAALVASGAIGLTLAVKNLMVSQATVVWPFVFLLLVVGLSQVPTRLIVNRFTQFMGVISFSVYIWHFLILNKIELLTGGLEPSILRFAANFALLMAFGVVVGYPSWRYLEEPGREFGGRLIRRRRDAARNARPVPEVAKAAVDLPVTTSVAPEQ